MGAISGETLDLAQRLGEAIELLESIAADGSLLDGVSDAERRRLLEAIAGIYSPDRIERRRMSRVLARNRKAARMRQVDGVRAATGIRALRGRPLFHSPNIQAPDGFEPHDIGPDDPRDEEPAPPPDDRVAAEPQVCYVCKTRYAVVHHFYDQLCPACAGINFAKRT